MTTSDLGLPAQLVRLTLSGEIDVASAPDAFARVVEALPSPADLVTLDLGDVEFIDCAGVAMLLKARNYLDGMRCRLILANPSAPVMRLLGLLDLIEQFSFQDDAPERGGGARNGGDVTSGGGRRRRLRPGRRWA